MQHTLRITLDDDRYGRLVAAAQCSGQRVVDKIVEWIDMHTGPDCPRCGVPLEVSLQAFWLDDEGNWRSAWQEDVRVMRCGNTACDLSAGSERAAILIPEANARRA